MAFIPTIFCGCAPLQSTLDKYWSEKNTPMGRDKGSTSFLQFLLSAENNRNRTRLTSDITAVAGKKRPVTMMYDEPVCVTVCLKTGLCSDVINTIDSAINCVTYDITDMWTTCKAGANVGFGFSRASFQSYCNLENGAYMQKRFAEFDRQLFEGLNEQMWNLEQIILNQQPVTNIVSAFPILTPPTATGWQGLNPMFFNSVAQKFQDINMAGVEYVIFGGSMVNTLSTILKVSNASQEGVDVNMLGSIPKMYYDKNFDAKFGADTIHIIPLGALQLVTYTENLGESEFRGEQLIKSSKVYNLGNGNMIPFDYQWEFEPKCGEYKYLPYIYADLVKAQGGGCNSLPNQIGIFSFTNCTTTVQACI